LSVPPGGPAALDKVAGYLQGEKIPPVSYVPDDEIRKDTVDGYLKQHPILGD
jgi:hypothetical protein